MSGENENDGFLRVDETLLDQLFQTGECYGGGRLASDPVGADFGFGQSDFGFAYLFYRSFGGFENAQGFFPGGGISDANGGGHGFGLDGDKFLPAVLANAAEEWVGAFGLNDGEFGKTGDEAEFLHFAKGFAEGRGVS